MWYQRFYEKKLVEEHGGELWGYEFKWGDKSVKAPKGWLETYDRAHFETIHRGNFLEFIG